MKKSSPISARVREYVAAHPEAKPKEVAKALRVHVRNVYAARYKTPKTPVKTIPAQLSLPLEEPNIVRQAVPAPSVLPGVDDITLSFIKMNLSKEELVGFYKGAVISHSVGTTAFDAAAAGWYAEKLHSVLAS
jgi:hypothetical protein